MIHRIRIQNYKSIRDVTVDLSPVTVLIGRSGTGKTNFCEAIRLLRDGIQGSAGDLGSRYAEAKPISHDARGVAFELEFALNGYESRFTYEAEFGPGIALKAETLNYGLEVVFSQRFDTATKSVKWIVQPPMDSPPPAGKIAIGALPMVDYAVKAYMFLKNGIGVYSFPYHVLETPNWSGDGKFTDVGGNALGVLRAIWTNQVNRMGRKNIEVILRQVSPSVESIEIDSIDQPKTLNIRHRIQSHDVVVSVQRESSGFRRFLAHLLALYQTPPKQTLIFEEPENAIFPGALVTLAEEFKATPEEGRGQVILTTHNPVLLNHFDADQIRVVELDDNLETQIGPLAADQKEGIREHLMEPGELFTVDRPRREVVAQ